MKPRLYAVRVQGRTHAEDTVRPSLFDCAVLRGLSLLPASLSIPGSAVR
jgi:hypothetical protein